MDKRESEKHYFDLLFGSGIVAMIIVSIFKFHMTAILFPLIGAMIGALMILSSKVKSYSYIGKALHWFSVNVARPKSEHNHLVWGGIVVFLSLSSIELTMDNHKLWDSVKNDIQYLLIIPIIVVLLVVAGLHSARNCTKEGG